MEGYSKHRQEIRPLQPMMGYLFWHRAPIEFMVPQLPSCHHRLIYLLRYISAALPKYNAMGNETFSGRVLSAVR